MAQVTDKLCLNFSYWTWAIVFQQFFTQRKKPKYNFSIFFPHFFHIFSAVAMHIFFAFSHYFSTIFTNSINGRRACQLLQLKAWYRNPSLFAVFRIRGLTNDDRYWYPRKLASLICGSTYITIVHKFIAVETSFSI